MSCNGSFVTSRILCHKCYEHAKAILKGEGDKWLSGAGLVFPNGAEQGIVAGMISDSGDFEYLDMLIELGPKLQKVICCEITIVVINENGDRVNAIFLKPGNRTKEGAIEERNAKDYP